MSREILSCAAQASPDSLHAGAVSLLRLLDLYGERHRAELEELWAAPETDYLVLFADDAGVECAILPVGAAHAYSELSKVLHLRLEGLHAVCFTPALSCSGNARFGSPELAAYAKDYPACAPALDAALTSAKGDPVRAALAHLAARLRDVARQEGDLAARERDLHDAEERLDERAHAHLVKLAELEQREHELESARLSVARRAL